MSDIRDKLNNSQELITNTVMTDSELTKVNVDALNINADTLDGKHASKNMRTVPESFPSDANWDDYNTAGHFQGIATSHTNQPESGAYNWHLVVTVPAAGSSAHQEAYKHENDVTKVFTRSWDNTFGWKPWGRQLTDAVFGKTEIDALGIDAETLDDLNSTQFLRSDADDSTTHDLTVGGLLKANGGLVQDAHTILNGVDTWLRTETGNGWYAAAHNTGIYATENGVVRVYNSGRFQIDSTEDNALEVKGGVTLGGNAEATIRYNTAENSIDFIIN